MLPVCACGPLPLIAGYTGDHCVTVRRMEDTVSTVDHPELLVVDAGEWRRWLRTHHGDSPGVWLVLAKKGTADSTTISYDEALDEAICFGWIDGQLGRRDSATFRRRFTPRKARSPWSQRNAGIAERLITTGRMPSVRRDCGCAPVNFRCV